MKYIEKWNDSFFDSINNCKLWNEPKHYIKRIIKEMISLHLISIHYAIVMAACFILLFSNNIFYIFILLNIVCIDILCIIVLQQCPVFKLEKKYKKVTTLELKAIYLGKYNFEYNCRHYYEMQLDFLINLQASIFLKIVSLIVFSKIREK
jgi:hypothetical protein